MGMFDSYDNIKDHYIPSNKPTPPTQNDSIYHPLKPNKPFEKYNAEGELIGYYWYYGDTVNLEFTIEGEVVNEDSSKYIDAAEFMKDKQVTVQICNFRREPIITKTYAGDAIITFAIDEEISKKLVRGNYYCTVTVFNNHGLNKTLFYQDDCTLYVE